MLTQGKKDLIIVPYDFTDQAETALLHASTIAAQNKDEVRLLHIINDQSKTRLKNRGYTETTIEGALKEIAARNQTTHGVTTSFHAEEGNLLTDIGAYAKQSGAQFCVMGTHGVHGIQHIVGANAMKVVASSPAPVIIVQKRKPDSGGYKKIVLPIDENKRGKNKIAYTISIAKYFKSEVFIFEAHTTDEYAAHHIANSTQLAVEYFRANGIRYQIEKEQPGKGTYAKQLIRFSGEIGADLVAISSHHDREGVVDFFLSHHEVDIINNDLQMAVMCVNPMEPVDHLEIGSFNW
jgi:nucleotide-binding universal stress UspA family protein